MNYFVQLLLFFLAVLGAIILGSCMYFFSHAVLIFLSVGTALLLFYIMVSKPFAKLDLGSAYFYTFPFFMCLMSWIDHYFKSYFGLVLLLDLLVVITSGPLLYFTYNTVMKRKNANQTIQPTR